MLSVIIPALNAAADLPATLAALEQSLEIECAPGGVALVSDAFTVHDPTGCGRGFRRLRSSTILRCLGELALTLQHVDIGVQLGPTPRAGIGK